MEFQGEYRIPAGQEKVWAALNDVRVLQASIAGCQQLDKVSDTEFNAIVGARVGPIAVTFRGSVQLSDLNAPYGYTLTGQGQGGAAGFARMIARVQLESLGEQETLLRYTAQADIGGKLASVGSRLVQGVAKKNADDFFTALTRQLTGQGHSEDAELAANSQKKSSKAKTSESLDRAQLLVGGGGLGAPVPAWIVVFGTALGIALGYCLGLLAR